MHITQLHLENYRNIQQLDLEFSPTINIFIGNNAQGKTNIMESIYVLAFTKSHRTSNDRELIRWNSEYGKIKGNIHKKYGKLPLELAITKKGKKAKLNHIEQSKLSAYIGQLNVVMFAPEDLNIVKGAPQLRRRFLDMEIGQISSTYLHDLVQFQKNLKQRNALLKNHRGQPTVDEVLYDIYTEQYVDAAIKVIQKRFYFIELLQQWAAPIHSGISKGTENLEIRYLSLKGIHANMEEEKMKSIFFQRLKENRARERERGLTLVGPHRDDLQFMVNDYDIQLYGSQGQQRTTALSLKLAEIELVKQEVGEPPILLLDDVLSELDDERQSHLIQTMLGQVQTFVTTTNITGISEEMLQQASIYDVEAGTIQLRR